MALKDYKNCNEIVADDNYVYCLRSRYSMAYLTLKRHNDDIYSDIPLIAAGNNFKVISHNELEFIFAMIHEDRKAILIYTQDKKLDKININYLAKRKFYCNSLTITDYYTNYDTKKKEINVLVLDQVANKLRLLVFSPSQRNDIKVV